MFQQTPDQAPMPTSVAVLRPLPRPASGETIELLQHLLEEALAGRVTGLALVALHADGQFDLRIRGDATTESNQMGVAGMLAGLQKMVLELY
jgi:hypothetical protein